MELMQENNALLVTDLARQSILKDARTARRVAEETARDGSSSAMMAIRELQVKATATALTIVIGAIGAAELSALLRGRTGFGRPFRILGSDAKVMISPAQKPAWKLDGEKQMMMVGLPAEGAKALAAVLRPVRGEYRVGELPGVTVKVVPSEIKDADGKTVVEVIG
jgi:hypothetical protein